jgi:hypothetical protein
MWDALNFTKISHMKSKPKMGSIHGLKKFDVSKKALDP